MSETTSSRISKPTPPPMPDSRAGWMVKRDIKAERTINDYVEDVHLKLMEDPDPNISAVYGRYLYACWDTQAVEGSLSADNTLAAQMIRENAPVESVLKQEKLATIVKSLGVVLRRYHESRKERRQRVGEETVPDGDGE